MGARIIYFSSATGNTHRFVGQLGEPGLRLPLHTRDETLTAEAPFVLVTPTYGGDREGHAVPKQVIKFLNVEANRNLIRGVVAGGNRNFFDTFCLAGDVISAKCRTPYLYRFELSGTPEEAARTRLLIDRALATAA